MKSLPVWLFIAVSRNIISHKQTNTRGSMQELCKNVHHSVLSISAPQPQQLRLLSAMNRMQKFVNYQNYIYQHTAPKLVKPRGQQQEVYVVCLYCSAHLGWVSIIITIITSIRPPTLPPTHQTKNCNIWNTNNKIPDTYLCLDSTHRGFQPVKASVQMAGIA